MSKTGWLATALIVVLITSIGLSTLAAQDRRGSSERAAEAKEVTLSGTLVDLQCYMSGKLSEKNAVESARACIRRGVPAALETKDGVIVMGMAKGTSAKLALNVLNTVEVAGVLYEKHGLKYLEVASIKAVKQAEEAESEEGDYDDEYQYDDEDEPEEDPESPEVPDESALP